MTSAITLSPFEYRLLCPIPDLLDRDGEFHYATLSVTENGHVVNGDALRWVMKDGATFEMTGEEEDCARVENVLMRLGSSPGMSGTQVTRADELSYTVCENRRCLHTPRRLGHLKLRIGTEPLVSMCKAFLMWATVLARAREAGPIVFDEAKALEELH